MFISSSTSQITKTTHNFIHTVAAQWLCAPIFIMEAPRRNSFPELLLLKKYKNYYTTLRSSMLWFGKRSFLLLLAIDHWSLGTKINKAGFFFWGGKRRETPIQVLYALVVSAPREYEYFLRHIKSTHVFEKKWVNLSVNKTKQDRAERKKYCKRALRRNLCESSCRRNVILCKHLTRFFGKGEQYCWFGSFLTSLESYLISIRSTLCHGIMMSPNMSDTGLLLLLVVGSFLMTI